MFTPTTAFSGFSVNDLQQAKKFYTEVLELETQEEEYGLEITLPGGALVIAYAKENHQPATFTILNFVVDSVDEAVAELSRRDVTFERYEGMSQDEKGIMRGLTVGMGPDIAWFKDPAGNIISVMQQE